MPSPTYHLAQYNIARLIHPIDSPESAEFVAQLDEVNALAEQAPGFVWRLQSDSGNATDIDAYGDPAVIVNMSVWQTIDDLFNFAYRERHLEVFRRRAQWFERHEQPHLVMWWVPAGQIPTVEEAIQRLNTLIENGPTAEAFTFKARFPTPNSKL
jgi:hypothetical protein